MQCPNCGSWVNEGEMFCGECGMRVQVEAPLPPGIQPLSQPAPKRGLGTVAKVVIVVILLLVLVVGAAIMFSLLGCGGCCFYFGQEAPLEITLDYPQTVKVSEEFTLRVTLRNVGDGNVPIDGLWFDDALLEGVTVVRSDPPFRGRTPLFDATSFKYEINIPPGETTTVTFQMQAIKIGEYEGSFTASSDPGSKATRMRIVVQP